MGNRRLMGEMAEKRWSDGQGEAIDMAAKLTVSGDGKTAEIKAPLSTHQERNLKTVTINGTQYAQKGRPTIEALGCRAIKVRRIGMEEWADLYVALLKDAESGEFYVIDGSRIVLSPTLTEFHDEREARKHYRDACERLRLKAVFRGEYEELRDFPPEGWEVVTEPFPCVPSVLAKAEWGRSKR